MNERFALVKQALEKMLQNRQYSALRSVLVTMNPSDIAGLFSDLDGRQISLLFRLLPKELAAETFVEMQPDEQETLVRGFSDQELKEILDELYDDDAADLVEEMPANVVKRILKQADPQMRSAINQILRYPENSAGSEMTTEYVSLRPDMTVVDISSESERRSSGSAWYEMDVTAMVQSWLLTPSSNYGFVIRENSESDTSHWTSFYSCDGSTSSIPELIITYTGSAPPEPPPETTSSTEQSDEEEQSSVTVLALYDNGYVNRYTDAQARW